jgi:hypothetical protein
MIYRTWFGIRYLTQSKKWWDIILDSVIDIIPDPEGMRTAYQNHEGGLIAMNADLAYQTH